MKTGLLITARLKSKTPKVDNRTAPIKVAKIPNCAAAPKNSVLGLASKGPKSVIAPTPIKIMSGKAPLSMPTV